MSKIPTNEERREVARRLRGDPYDTLIPYRTGIHFGMGCHEAANRFWDMCERIKSAGDYDIAYSTRYMLADLIEPEPERTCKFIHHECRHPNEKDSCDKYQDCEWSCAKDSLYCSSCDKCVAVSFAEQLKVKKYSFCPYCDAKVVDE